MSKKIKVALTVLAATFALGAVAPVASAEPHTVGSALNDTLVALFQGGVGGGVPRLP